MSQKTIKIFLLAIFAALNINFSANCQTGNAGFIHREEGKLVLNGKEIQLKGVSFGNEVWTYTAIPQNHHSAVDFKRVADMGMNVVRFYLNYSTFEDDEAPFEYKDAGWEWLDKNIAWAKANNVYLILNMHVPQGGFQSLGKGHELWTNKINQKRLVSLWRAIAARYKNEPTIAGYDLLNEPHVTSSIEQWQTLAQEITDAIRVVDKNHLIIIERLNAIFGDWSTDNGQQNFFLVNDDNVMYEFHFYNPIEYTHQNTPWTGFGDGGKYPDNDILEFPPDLTWFTSTFDNPKLDASHVNWVYLEGDMYQVDSDEIIAAKPSLLSSKNEGETYFTSFIITEFDEDKKFVRDIMTVELNNDENWKFWSKNNEGTFAIKENVDYSGKSALIISGTTDHANCYNNALRFRVKKGYHYTISGWAKVAQMTIGAECGYRLDFERSESGGTILKRNKVYLEHHLNKYLLFGRKYNVPMYCGEFGVYKKCFEKRNGGEKWVSDMLSLFKKYDVHFSYHTYHEEAFGIYTNTQGLPDPGKANDDLINVFKENLLE